MADPTAITGEQLAAVSAAPLPFFGALLAAWAITTTVTWLIVNQSKKDQIDTLNERIKHRDEEIERLKARAADAKDEASKREDRIKAAEAEVKSYDGQIDKLANDAIARDRQLLDLTEELQKARADLEAAKSKSVAVEFVDRVPAPVPTPDGHKPSRESALPNQLAVAASHIRKPLLLEVRGRHGNARRLTRAHNIELMNYLKGVSGKVRIVMDEGVPDADIYGSDFIKLFKAAGWQVSGASTFAEDPVPGGLMVCCTGDDDTIPLEFTVSLFEAGIPFGIVKEEHEADIELRVVQRAK
jgi:hypothetical protein